MSGEADDEWTYLYIKLVAQLCSTVFSTFVGAHHLVHMTEHLWGCRLNNHGSANQSMPGRSTYTLGSCSPSGDDRVLTHQEGTFQSPATLGDPVYRPPPSTSTLILRAACFSDMGFSIFGAIATSYYLSYPEEENSFSLTAWAKGPHWSAQIASFCWMGTLGLYIAKKNRQAFDFSVAHVIIWLIMISYWIFELFVAYFGDPILVRIAKALWGFSAVSNFVLVNVCWLIFAKRWRESGVKRSSYVMSMLLSYTIVYLVFVSPIVCVDVIEVVWVHENGVDHFRNIASIILAFWPTSTALIYLIKPRLCLRAFEQSYNPTRGNIGSSRRSRLPTVLGTSENRNGIGIEVSTQGLHDLKGLVIGDKIGEGIAVVYLGKWRGADVAVKMKALQLDSSENIQEFQDACNKEIQLEAEVMKGLCHPNIVLFMEAGFYKGSICIISEYCARGSLRDVLKNSDVVNLSWATKVRLALGMCHGIQYIHNANPPMIHRDLKSPNVLVDNSWHAKIADFGTLRFAEIVSCARASTCVSKDRDSAVMTGLVGTTRWMAPEVIRGDKIYTCKVDIYSLALILWELIEGKLPFQSMKWNYEIENIVLKGMRPNIKSEKCPLQWRLLIVTCWQADPDLRPSISEVISSLQRIAREERWDTSGPRFTDASWESSAMASSMMSGASSMYGSPSNNQPWIFDGDANFPHFRLPDQISEIVPLDFKDDFRKNGLMDRAHQRRNRYDHSMHVRTGRSNSSSEDDNNAAISI